ncbi:MAG: NUDIX hydrolase [Nanobdellota archaeon]
MKELSGCAVIRNGRLLLLYKIDEGYFEHPGGKIKGNETPAEAALRELKEETGCTGRIISYLGSYDVRSKGIKVHLYETGIDETPEIKEKDKFSEIIWMPIKEYKKYKLAENVKEFCSTFFSDRSKHLCQGSR